jgi:uncharacterized protein
MHLVRIEDPAQFRRRAFPLLLKDEARHNVMLGIAGLLEEHPDAYAEFHLWVVEEAGRAVAAASWTPPFNVVVARPERDEALSTLAAFFQREEVALPGVTGAVPEVDRFVGEWERLTGRVSRRRMAQGIYRLETVRPAGVVPGAMRPATMADREWLVSWIRDFSREALDESAVARSEEAVDRRLRGEGGELLVWVDGDPVSLAGWGGATPNGVRIGPVYTPPALRGRGYAGALVSELSSRLFSEGRRFCFLYTDLSNPISNRLYERIGYERVCVSMDYELSGP